MLSLNSAIQGIFIGLIIAVLVIGYNKLVIGKFVKALIKAEANHPLRAKSFEQLGVSQNIFIKIALRKRSTLRRIVCEPKDREQQGLFYIPEDKLYRAGRIYGGKDVDILMIAAVIVVLFIFFGIVLIFLPDLIQSVYDTFGL